MSQHKSAQGYFTFAQNTASVDYLTLAYTQALNIKSTQHVSEFAVAVDSSTRQCVTDEHLRVFDHVIEIPEDLNSADSDWKLANEWQVFWLTPFKETIKLESDVLFTRSIDHWWTAFRNRDVCLSTGCLNYLQQSSDVRKYRETFDRNGLPDVYNGIMYFRYSKTAFDFFMAARRIWENWTQVRDSVLTGCDEATPSTDMLYALAAQVTGPELCTAPVLDFVKFVHMKPAINGFPEHLNFTEVFCTEFSDHMIRINNINQYQPVHYYHKGLVAEHDLQDHYGRLAGVS